MKENSEDPQAELLKSFAIAHLGMIVQAAKGIYTADPVEIDEREAWLIGYIRNGVGLATEENKRLAESVHDVLSTQSVRRTDQSEAA
jgi:hypothetical protein